jgi:uncharacterized protein YndB with AHSA1/START domain
MMAEIKHQIPISATPEKVYAALTTEKGLRGWWTADSKTDDKVGGKAEFGFDKRGTVFRMNIEKLEPNQLVVWKCHGDNPEWNGTTLTWNIAAKNGMTVLRFTHSGWKAVTEFCAICNSSWGELMYRLKDFVEGKHPGPHWKE